MSSKFPSQSPAFMEIILLHPLGTLVAGARSKVWVQVRNKTAIPLPQSVVEPGNSALSLRSRWLDEHGNVVEQDHARASIPAGLEPDQVSGLELEITGPESEGRYVLELELVNEAGTWFKEEWGCLQIPVTVKRFTEARAAMTHGVEPLSYAWGTDRGLPVHRYYLEKFLEEHAGVIRGHCLEFQNPQYTPRFGGAAISKLDILHIDASNPLATMVADLTRPNDLPGNHFDCIVCTHVLHVIYEVERAVAELHRILKPGGVLLIAVPQISMADPRYGELWRFTPEGLHRVLTSSFQSTQVTVQAYGNSLTAAGELRGMVSAEFAEYELEQHDPWFAVEVCARAVKDL